MKRGCPSCYQKWASHEGKVSATRLWISGYSIARGKPFKRGFRVLHCVVSLPQGDYNENRDKARKICKRHGLLGGLMVWHPFRQDDDKQYVPDGYEHYHVIGLARGDVKPGGMSLDGKAIFKVIPDAKRGDYRGFMRSRDVKNCIRYLLTHCGILEGRHSLTWWGVMSYNSMSNAKLDLEFPGVMSRVKEFKRRCKFCGSEDIEYAFYIDRTSYPWDYVVNDFRCRNLEV
jgi:hypothetical protein